MVPGHAEHLLTRASEQGVIDRDGDRRTGGQQPGNDQVSQGQPDLVGAPAGGGEEPVRPTVMPEAFQPGAQQHPADGSAAGLGDQPEGKALER